MIQEKNKPNTQIHKYYRINSKVVIWNICIYISIIVILKNINYILTIKIEHFSYWFRINIIANVFFFFIINSTFYTISFIINNNINNNNNINILY